MNHGGGRTHENRDYKLSKRFAMEDPSRSNEALKYGGECFYKTY